VGGLVVGAVFGVLAIADKSAAGCDGNNRCSIASEVAAVQRDSTVSTIGFAAGSGLLAAGLVLVLIQPSERRPAVAWGMSPLPSGAVVTAVGGF
jgi:hypothetical protein